MKRVGIGLGLLAMVLTIAGCEKQVEAPPYNTSLSVKEIMGHNMDVGAQKFWCASGDITTETGTVSRAPTNEEGWEDAVSGATIIAEGGNLLMMPGRARDNGDWMKLAKKLTDVALEGRLAADARDVDKVFETGGRIYEVCVECHNKYLLPFIDAETGEPIKGSPLDSGVKEEQPAEPPSPNFICPKFPTPQG